MTIHEKIYREFFGLAPDDPIYSETSGELASEIHHIHPKGMGGRKTFVHGEHIYDIECIENYIALTRKEHEAVNVKYSKDQLWRIHQITMTTWRTKPTLTE